MHVLILGAGWPPEVFIERKLRALVAAGVRVSLAEKPRPLDSPWNGIPGVEFLPLRDPRDHSLRAVRTVGGRLLRAWRQGFGVPFRIWKIAGRHAQGLGPKYALWRHGLALVAARPDVIHFEWNRAAIRYEWIFDYFDCPTVISCRGRQTNILPHLPGFEEYRENLIRTLKKASLVHCVSEAMRADAIALGVSPDRAVVIRTCFDPELYRDPELPARTYDSDKPLNLITIGGLIWRKGFEYLIRAVAEVVRRGGDARLDIIGSGPEMERIRHAVDEMGMADRVKLLGQLPPAEVQRRVAAADAYVLSSLSEGLSNSVIEAMACSLPVITTTCGGMDEAVKDEVEGLLVAPRDVNGMADAICRLEGDPQLRRRMGAAGRAAVLRDYTPERQSADFIELYGRAVAIDRQLDPPSRAGHN